MDVAAILEIVRKIHDLTNTPGVPDEVRYGLHVHCGNLYELLKQEEPVPLKPEVKFEPRPKVTKPTAKKK